nr:hypothetical protein HK105_001161 [Polyrhizophydium stewartii]
MQERLAFLEEIRSKDSIILSQYEMRIQQQDQLIHEMHEIPAAPVAPKPAARAKAQPRKSASSSHTTASDGSAPMDVDPRGADQRRPASSFNVTGINMEGQRIRVDLSADKLTPWTSIVRRQRKDGGRMLKTADMAAINEAVGAFLAQSIPVERVVMCKLQASRDQGPVNPWERCDYAIPEALVDSFQTWFSSQLREGLLDSRLESSPEPAADNEDHDSDAAEADNAPAFEAEDNQDDAQPAGVETESPEVMPDVPSSKWPAWTEVVRACYPQFRRTRKTYDQFASDFMSKNDPDNVVHHTISNANRGDLSVVAVPPYLQKQFMQAFVSEFEKGKWPYGRCQAVKLPMLRAEESDQSDEDGDRDDDGDGDGDGDGEGDGDDGDESQNARTQDAHDSVEQVEKLPERRSKRTQKPTPARRSRIQSDAEERDGTDDDEKDETAEQETDDAREEAEDADAQDDSEVEAAEEEAEEEGQVEEDAQEEEEEEEEDSQEAPEEHAEEEAEEEAEDVEEEVEPEVPAAAAAASRAAAARPRASSTARGDRATNGVAAVSDDAGHVVSWRGVVAERVPGFFDDSANSSRGMATRIRAGLRSFAADHAVAQTLGDKLPLALVPQFVEWFKEHARRHFAAFDPDLASATADPMPLDVDAQAITAAFGRTARMRTQSPAPLAPPAASASQSRKRGRASNPPASKAARISRQRSMSPDIVDGNAPSSPTRLNTSPERSSRVRRRASIQDEPASRETPRGDDVTMTTNGDRAGDGSHGGAGAGVTASTASSAATAAATAVAGKMTSSKRASLNGRGAEEDRDSDIHASGNGDAEMPDASPGGSETAAAQSRSPVSHSSQTRRASSPDRGVDRNSLALGHILDGDAPTTPNQPYAIINGQVDPMTRYNHVLLSMMPNYNSRPKSRRIEMKRLVKAFLLNRMGDSFSTCVIFTDRADKSIVGVGGDAAGAIAAAAAGSDVLSASTSSGDKRVHHTYGIAKSIEQEFRAWAAVEMRRLFGDF